MENLKIGDIVVLWGANVPMTVEGIIDNQVWCAWFDKMDLLHRDSFVIETLRLLS